MPISENTRNFLEEWRKAGVDPTILASLERDLDQKPAADKVSNDGVLAQRTFNNYKSNKEKEIDELKSNITKLASLQGAANNLDGDLQKAAVEQIAALEKLFEANGYDLEEVRAEAAKLVSDPNALKSLIDNKDRKEERETEMPNPQDTKDYVDTKTFADTLLTAGSNIASGNINMAIHIARALREADKLGIDLSDEKLDGFHPAILKGFEQNKQPAQVMDEYFGFSAIRKQKDEDGRKAELAAAEEKGKQEAFKQMGVSPRRQALNNRPANLILDRKRIEAKQEVKEVNNIDDLPKNEKGDPEYFRLRRYNQMDRRQSHAENASRRWEEVSEHFDEDGLPTSLLNRATA